MKCEVVQHLLEPYRDGELDLVRHLDVESHVSGCADCREQDVRLKALRGALAPEFKFRAPTSLRERIQKQVAGANVRVAESPLPQQTPVRSSRAWLPPTWMHQGAMAAGVMLLLGVTSLAVLSWQSGASSDERFAERVIASHVRALQVDHLTDVVSSDRHTVKPWFLGKIDFAPLVPDLAMQGYPLAGGRLDYLNDRPVAALAYYRRLHAINLFTWPTTEHRDLAVQAFTRQGFHIRRWQTAGMSYWAISDLNDQELDEFVRLYQEQLAK